MFCFAGYAAEKIRLINDIETTVKILTEVMNQAFDDFSHYSFIRKELDSKKLCLEEQPPQLLHSIIMDINTLITLEKSDTLDERGIKKVKSAYNEINRVLGIKKWYTNDLFIIIAEICNSIDIPREKHI